MPKIDLDGDVVDYLRSQVSDFGETPSTVLRRLLRLPSLDQAGSGLQLPAPPATLSPARQAASRNHVVITPSDLAQADTAIERLMLVLSKLHLAYQDRFDRVTAIRGRTRLYFSRNCRELEEAGNSVAPRIIRGTPYFMVTNLSDAAKREILERVVTELGCPPGMRPQLLALLDTERVPHQEIDLGPAGSAPPTGPGAGLQI